MWELEVARILREILAAGACRDWDRLIELVKELELRGFRNQLWWRSRKWDQEPAWSLDQEKQEPAELDARAVESLESGHPPGTKLEKTFLLF